MEKNMEDKILKIDSNQMELVDFRIFSEQNDEIYEGIYGINVSKVREIIKFTKLTELPGTNDYVEGIFDLRGKVIPVINLSKWLGITNKKIKIENTKIIITEFNNISVGFIVHEANRIRRISWKDIESLSFQNTNSAIDNSKITGVTKLENDEVLLILDLEKVLLELGLTGSIEIETKEKSNKYKGFALILDDSSTARKILKEALTKLGLTVIEAIDGIDGIKKIEDFNKTNNIEELKIIISDIEMPQMDGYHFAAKLKEDIKFNKIPIIFNSSISNENNVKNSKKIGVEDYLVKFDYNDFFTTVTRILDKEGK